MSYSKLKKAELVSELADRDATIESLRAQLQDQAERQADEAIEASRQVDESIVDKVNTRVNEYGTILNCRIAEDYEGDLTIRTLARALRTQLAPRGKRRTDANGRTWVDVYPSVEQQVEVQS